MRCDYIVLYYIQCLCLRHIRSISAYVTSGLSLSTSHPVYLCLRHIRSISVYVTSGLSLVPCFVPVCVCVSVYETRSISIAVLFLPSTYVWSVRQKTQDKPPKTKPRDNPPPQFFLLYKISDYFQ